VEATILSLQQLSPGAKANYDLFNDFTVDMLDNLLKVLKLVVIRADDPSKKPRKSDKVSAIMTVHSSYDSILSEVTRLIN
jgi:hypothetical protein